jgi:TRAP-type C4-dicarboxylate transport system permease small subunit
MGEMIPLIILLLLCCLCCVSMISVSFGGYRWWKSRSSKYRSQTKISRRRPRAKNV